MLWLVSGLEFFIKYSSSLLSVADSRYAPNLGQKSLCGVYNYNKLQTLQFERFRLLLVQIAHTTTKVDWPLCRGNQI